MIILKVIYLGLPAIVANSLPIIFAKYQLLEFLNKPVDFNLKLFKNPLFGRTKTWRGFFVGISGGLVTGYLQAAIYPVSQFIRDLSLINYQAENIFLIGFLLSFGALFGDLIKSFIKRRLAIASGKSWWPWDFLDATLGSLIFISLVVHLDWSIIIISLVLCPTIHLLANFFSYQLKLKNAWR